MRYFLTPGKMRRFFSKISRTERPSLNWALLRSCSAQSKPNVMACSISGWTRAASTRQAAPNFKSPSTVCSAGIAMLRGVMCIYRMFQRQRGGNKMGATLLPIRGKLTFGIADGSPVAGLYRSFWLRRLSSSFPVSRNSSETRNLWNSRSIMSRESPSRPSVAIPCLATASLSGWHG